MVRTEDEPLYVLESKRKCLESGMDPNIVRIPQVVMTELELANKKKTYEEIFKLLDFSVRKY